jgi:DNA modification methylase
MEKHIYFKADNFTLLTGDSFKLLKRVEPKSVNLIFADPPYFLSSGGISCQNGKQVSVDKGEWDLSKSIEDRLKYHRKWISLCREILDDNGTIMISSTLHSVYAIGVALEMEGFSIINNIIWRKTNPAPNLACRCLTHSTETVIWARKQLTSKKKGHHYFNYDAMKQFNKGKQLKDVWEIDDDILSMAKGSTGSNVGTGGMATKLTAAKIATYSGADMIITNGDNVSIIEGILEGKSVGTCFHASLNHEFSLSQFITESMN